MKAIQINHYLDSARPILHTDVVETARTHLSHRQFECKCCGLNWREELNEPASVIEDEQVLNHLEEYYPNYELCSESGCYVKS